MKKSTKIIIILLGAIIAVSLIFLFMPLGTQEYTSENTNITFNVPRLSIFKNECCMFSANFISFRSVESLRLDIEKVLGKYELINCNDRTYYYDSKQNFTITEYSINKGLILNDFWIVYDKGNYCNQIYEVKYDFKSNYDFKNAEQDGYVVFGNSQEVINQDKIFEFYNNSKNNVSGSITIILVTIEGQPIIEQYHYKNGEYTLFRDTTRDDFSSKEIIKKEIKDIELIDMNGKTYLQEKQ